MEQWANLAAWNICQRDAIALAYFAIRLELVYFMRQRRDLPFPAIVWAFVIFILGCGTTHVMEVVNALVPHDDEDNSLRLGNCCVSTDIRPRLPRAGARLSIDYVPLPTTRFCVTWECSEWMAERLRDRHEISPPA